MQKAHVNVTGLRARELVSYPHMKPVLSVHVKRGLDTLSYVDWTPVNTVPFGAV